MGPGSRCPDPAGKALARVSKWAVIRGACPPPTHRPTQPRMTLLRPLREEREKWPRLPAPPGAPLAALQPQVSVPPGAPAPRSTPGPGPRQAPAPRPSQEEQAGKASFECTPSPLQLLPRPHTELLKTLASPGLALCPCPPPADRAARGTPRSCLQLCFWGARAGFGGAGPRPTPRPPLAGPRASASAAHS